MLNSANVSIVKDPPVKPVDSTLGNAKVNPAMQALFEAALQGKRA